MRVLLLTLLLVGCGSPEDTWDTLNAPQAEVANIAHDGWHGTDDTEPTPTPTVPPQSDYETDYTQCETIACE